MPWAVTRIWAGAVLTSASGVAAVWLWAPTTEVALVTREVPRTTAPARSEKGKHLTGCIVTVLTLLLDILTRGAHPWKESVRSPCACASIPPHSEAGLMFA